MTFKRVDANQGAIVKALRDYFGSQIIVRSIASEGNGLPDLLVGVKDDAGIGHTILLECKDGAKPPSKQALTIMERSFHQSWMGGSLYVVNSPKTAIKAVLLTLKKDAIVCLKGVDDDDSIPDYPQDFPVSRFKPYD